MQQPDHADPERASLIAQIQAEEEAARIESMLDGNGESLAEFTRRLSPTLLPAPHLVKLQELFERARRSPIKACISMPPRHGKSVTIQHAIAWWLLHSPADTCAYSSYNDHVAWSQSRKIRRLGRRAGIQIAPDAASMGEWRTTMGGGLLACGVHGALTGHGVTGLMILDDAYKGREDANSPIMREKVWDFVTEVADSRLEDASMIVNGTRWHPNDAIAQLVEELGWEYINLAAIAEDDDPMGRASGEALWPDKFPLDVLEQKRAMNEYSFAALYQGRPRPRGNVVFGPPTYYDPTKTDLTGCNCVIGADPAASEKTSADFSAAVAFALKWINGLPWCYVIEVYHRQVQIPTFVADLRSFQARNWQAPAWVEAIGGFKAVPQMLRAVDKNIRLMEITHMEGDKFLRAQAFASAWNAGRVLVPNNSPPWLKSFLDEIARFTGVKDKKDDQVDASAHAFNAFVNAPPPVKRGSVATVFHTSRRL